tara:strand:- start:423 stop:857 length:435 start_codon:yes stop_codon:yes gene_type:complete
LFFTFKHILIYISISKNSINTNEIGQKIMPIMTLTDTAEKKIQELCSNNNKWAVRLGIKGGGCAGFSYDWGFADQGEMQDNDELIETAGGRLVVDSHSVMYLLGTELDYVNEVWGSHFDIKNPNAKSSCGCGESIQFDLEKVNG